MSRHKSLTVSRFAKKKERGMDHISFEQLDILLSVNGELDV